MLTMNRNVFQHKRDIRTDIASQTVHRTKV